MKMIDAHQHFWNKEKLFYPWLTPNQGCLYRNYEPEDLRDICQDAGVEKTIVVQAVSSIEETAWLLNLAEQNSFIGGVVGWVDLTDERLPEILEKLKQNDKFCGVRHQIEDEKDPEWMLREDVLRGLRAVSDAGLTFDALIRHFQFYQLETVVNRIPDLKIVIDHAGKPDIKNKKFREWAEHLRVAAAFPVNCKLSGMLTEAGCDTWTLETIQPYAEELIDVFGPARVMFGSDWPVSTKAATYASVVDTTRKLIRYLRESDQARILGENAATFYLRKENSVGYSVR